MERRLKTNEDEIPRSVLKMKQEKEKREKQEAKKINTQNKAKNNKEKLKDKKQNRKRKFKKFILIIIIIVLVVLGITLGVSAYTWKDLTENMFTNKNSVVVDVDGNVLATLGSEQKKLTADIEDMPKYLTDAYVSIEDERYYSHWGIDVKRTAGAILSYVTHFGNSSYGGSTITQQLVKNLTGDNTDSITRKVKEWWKAFLLERYFSKEEILEMYLNVIYVGPNVYGVQAGSKYYFDKGVSDLSLAECAYLAGINNSPNSYNPFGDDDNKDLIEKRTTTVLKKMLELGKITDTEYNKAVEEVEQGLDFKQGEIKRESSIYSYHTDALITDVIEDISEEKHISEDFAKNYLYLSGLTIHSTQDEEIQEETEKEFFKSQYKLNSKDGESTSQAAMVIIDHKTGEVLACTGGLGEKETFRGLNRATQSLRQTGSSIKPLAVLVPGIDKKTFTASTIYDDKKTTFAGEYEPSNNDGGYLGKITVRRALESSQNIPFVEMMEQVTPKRAIGYLENMGITSLTEGDESLALALGGLENGITPLEMAAAYATIANDGVYIEPTFYTTITNTKGKTIIEAKQKTKRVFSKEVAYVVKELLKQPVEGTYGTATYCSISGIDVAAKTGTTDDNFDKWLCGFTPYYTAVTWFGFDQNETIYYNNQNPAGIIWANVMRRVHNGLASERFEIPNRVEIVNICKATGMVARTGCKDVYQEYFLWGTVPDLCTKHSGSKLTSQNSTTEKEDDDKVYVYKNEDLKLNPNDDEEAPKVDENRIEHEDEVANNIKDEVEVTEPENIIVENTTTDNEQNDRNNEVIPEENTTVEEPTEPEPPENDIEIATPEEDTNEI